MGLLPRFLGERLLLEPWLRLLCELLVELVESFEVSRRCHAGDACLLSLDGLGRLAEVLPTGHPDEPDEPDEPAAAWFRRSMVALTSPITEVNLTRPPFSLDILPSTSPMAAHVCSTTSSMSTTLLLLLLLLLTTLVGAPT